MGTRCVRHAFVYGLAWHVCIARLRTCAVPLPAAVVCLAAHHTCAVPRRKWTR